MKQAIYILVSLLSFQFVAYAQFSNFEKPLQAELKRYMAGVKFTIKPMCSKHSNNGAFYELQGSQILIKYVYTGRVETARSGQGNDTSADYLDYFILFDANKIVQKVRIVNFQSDHGQAVTSAGWLKQFVGYHTNKSLEIGRNIDAISGATQTVNKLTFDIKSKTYVLAN